MKIDKEYWKQLVEYRIDTVRDNLLVSEGTYFKKKCYHESILSKLY